MTTIEHSVTALQIQMLVSMHLLAISSYTGKTYSQIAPSSNKWKLRYAFAKIFIVSQCVLRCFLFFQLHGSFIYRCYNFNKHWGKCEQMTQ